RELRDGPPLSADHDLCRLWRGPLDGLPDADAGPPRAGGGSQARAEDPVERRGGRRGDPPGAGGDPVPRGRLSEAPGPPGPPGRGHRRKRVLRLMRVHHLLAPRRLGPPNGDPAHAGTITTTHPDEMWGTDATRFYTEEDGWCWFVGAIDHCVDEL